MLNIGVIGAGYWGKNLVRVFAELRSSHLYACCDADRARLERIKQTYPDVKICSDVAALLTDDAIDAIVIATPSPTHYSLALQALSAGKHVYVEKPLTMKSDESVELTVLAQQRDLRLMVGHLLLYHPAVEQLRQLVQGGDLGEAYYIYTQRLNLGIVRRDENAWWSLAPHDISVILYLFDSVPASVSARGEGYLQAGNPDVVFATLHFPDRRMGQIHVSWLDPNKLRKLTVVGSRKMVVMDDMEPTEKIKIYDKGVNLAPGYESYGDAITLRQGDIHIPYIAMEEPLRIECQHFIDCIIQHATPRTDGVNGLHVVQVLEAGQRSLEQNGTPVKVN